MSQARAGQNRGEHLTLTCEVTGTPAPSVTPRRSRFGPCSQSGVKTPVISRPLTRHERHLYHSAPNVPSATAWRRAALACSQVPGRPLRTCPALRPRRTADPRPLQDRRCGLPAFEQRRLRICTLSRLNHAACTLSVYASQPGSLPDHATRDSGWWPALTGQGFHLLGRVEGFHHVCPSTWLPPSPSFCLAQSNLVYGGLVMRRPCCRR